MEAAWKITSYHENPPNAANIDSVAILYVQQRALLLWEDDPINDKNIGGLRTSLALSNSMFNITITS